MAQSQCRGCFDGAHELGGHAELEAVVRKCGDEYSTEELKSMIPGRTRLPGHTRDFGAGLCHVEPRPICLSRGVPAEYMVQYEPFLTILYVPINYPLVPKLSKF